MFFSFFCFLLRRLGLVLFKWTVPCGPAPAACGGALVTNKIEANEIATAATTEQQELVVSSECTYYKYTNMWSSAGTYETVNAANYKVCMSHCDYDAKCKAAGYGIYGQCWFKTTDAAPQE